MVLYKILLMESKNVFDFLSSINLNEKLKTKEGLRYIPWAFAWSIIKSNYPDSQFEVIWTDGLPYLLDPRTGYMVFTRVTIGGITHDMQLPVLDSANNQLFDKAYEKEYKSGNKRLIKPATMADINRAIMRCLTKNIALFGLGIYVYNGEEIPEGSAEKDNSIEEALIAIAGAKTVDELTEIYNQYQEFGKDKRFLQPLTAKKKSLKNEAKKEP